jgi:hypothetical protein
VARTVWGPSFSGARAYGKGLVMGARATRSPSAALAATLLALAVLTLAACGGSGTTASNSPSAAPSAAAVTATPSPSWSPTMSPAPIPVVKPGQKLPPFAKIAAMYAYDGSEPFDMSLGIAYQKGAATVAPIAFNANGRQVSGYLVMPQGDGLSPVVVWAPGHGGGYAVDMWLPDAVKLAKAGYAGLLLEEPGTLAFNRDAAEEGRGIIDYVVQTSRGLDLLATMPQIDAMRIGFVGWSMGTVPGAYLAGLNDRMKAFAFASTGGASGVSRTNAYDTQMSIFDPAVYFTRNKTAAFLFMWGRDELNATLKAWYLANAPQHATVRLHAPGHEVLADAHKILVAWIQKNL